jgi:hypothetical protein
LILNKKTDFIPEDSIYIGRGSKWGNPFKLSQDGSRTEVIIKYENWLKGQTDLVSSIDELQDKPLVCFCKPKSCHGDILIKVLMMTENQRKQWMAGDLNRDNFFQAEFGI